MASPLWVCHHISQENEVPEPVFNLEHGKGMDGLVEHEVVVDDLHDFAAVVAWGPKSMYMTFRGTASLKYGGCWYCGARQLITHLASQKRVCGSQRTAAAAPACHC